jgi:hypothetical protein
VLHYIPVACRAHFFLKHFPQVLLQLFFSWVCLQVEIVMGLEEEFGITVEETSAQTIATVEDAAELIDELVSKK